MARRFASDEVAGARVRASFEGLHVETTADEEGYFEVRFQLEEPLDGPGGWRQVGLELLTVSRWRKGKIEGTRPRSARSPFRCDQ